jgi:4-hydroxy-tetrahydrodipicolinate synthase
MNHSYTSYHGVFVPMASPADENGSIDVKSAGRLIEFLLDNGVVPFIGGTNGEGPSLSVEARRSLVRTLVDHRRDHIPLVAGIIGLPYNDILEQANTYFEMGVDAVVITLPNYYSLSSAEIKDFYSSAADNIDGNIILYNIPKTIHMSIPVDVIDELSHIENIIGIKDSEFDEARLERSLKLWKDRDDFFHLTGVNKLMVKGLMMGSRGIVPSTGNFVPAIYRSLYDLCREKKENEATKLLDRTQELCDVYQEGRSLASSLSALKVVLNHLGLCGKEVLKPLVKLEKTEEEKVIHMYKEKTIEV